MLILTIQLMQLFKFYKTYISMADILYLCPPVLHRDPGTRSPRPVLTVCACKENRRHCMMMSRGGACDISSVCKSKTAPVNVRLTESYYHAKNKKDNTMKKTATLLLLTVSLFGSDGYKVYQNNCQKCHIEMISKTETLKIFRTLKAPPMVEVSKQLKQNIIIKEDDEEIHRFATIAFIKEYLKKPSLDYSMCNPGAIDRFGIMPAQTQLSEEERQAVAEWIYDRYEGVDFK